MKGDAADASPTLEFWFDFASPYSYLAASRIEALLSTLPIRLRWRPFLLGPIFKRRPSNPSPFQGAGPEERRYRRRDVERLCERYGIPLSWPSSYPRGSILATRVALIASEAGWCGVFARTVFKANFSDDRDIATAATIADILFELQGDADEILARLHQLAGFGEAKPLESLGRESKGRHYTGSEGSGGRAEGRGRDFWWGLGGEVELQALQQE